MQLQGANQGANQCNPPLKLCGVLKMISSHRVDLQSDVEVRPRAVELLPLHYLSRGSEPEVRITNSFRELSLSDCESLRDPKRRPGG